MFLCSGFIQVWLWSKAKFINRKFLMEEVYQQGASLPALPQHKDPFWDPVEPVHLGSAHLWLHSLAFRIAVDEQVEVVGPEGTEEAMLHACLVPCCPKGLWVTFSRITVMNIIIIYTHYHQHTEHQLQCVCVCVGPWGRMISLSTPQSSLESGWTSS